MPPETQETTEQEEQEPTTPPKASRKPAPPEEGSDEEIRLSRAEHDRIQAENRRMRRELAKREEADGRSAKDREIQDAAARKDFDAALKLARSENEKLQRELQKTRAADALRDEIERRGLTGSRARAARRLAGQIEYDEDGFPVEGSVREAISGVIEDYPDIFGTAEADDEDDEERPSRVRRGRGPATPPEKTSMPEGFISPDEYQRTPAHVRQTPEFQKRVAASRPLWPGYNRDKKIRADTFAVGQ